MFSFWIIPTPLHDFHITNRKWLFLEKQTSIISAGRQVLLPVAALQKTAVHKERHAYDISGVFGGNISVVHADLSPVFILL